MHSSTILFSGGGTGGHLYPGLAVADVLRDQSLATVRDSVQLAFVGSQRPIEERILSAHGYPHHRLDIESSRGLRRNPLRFLWKYRRAVVEAHRLLTQTQPAVVVGLGGFASVPLLSAANRRRIPTILLEQNAVPGRATRWLCRKAAGICIAMAEASTALPRRCAEHTYVTGNPVRRDVSKLHQRQRAGGQPTLLVIGGSQGASAVNSVAAQTIVALGQDLSGWQIVHQTGEHEYERWRAHYQDQGLPVAVQPFLDDLPDHYADAELVISRAGATSLAELACAGCPSLLIPLPGSIYDHQHHNARVYCAAGAAQLIEQTPDLSSTTDRLITETRRLLMSPSHRDEMRQAMWGLARPDAAMQVAQRILIAAGHQSIGS